MARSGIGRQLRAVANNPIAALYMGINVDRAFRTAFGIGLALIMRLILLSMIAWIVGLTQPVFNLGFSGPLDQHGAPTFETDFSWRDLILIAGGLFLIWKATKEIHHSVDPAPADGVLDKKGVATMTFGAAIAQIIVLDMIFSLDSILTAVGMTDNLAV
ncbi:hypothetical protein LTR94_033257, partial [Friedmanniomyces endolithicus]